MLFYEAVDKGRSGEITPSKSSELPSPLLPPTGDEGLKQLQVYIYISICWPNYNNVHVHY